MSSEPYAIPPKDRAFEGILWYIKHYYNFARPVIGCLLSCYKKLFVFL